KSRMSLLAAQRLVVIDVETTGWRPADDAIIEIARVTIDHGAITERWSTLVQPGRPVPPDATRVHGISDAMLADAPTPTAIAAGFREACAGDTLVIHNAGFDVPLVNTMLRRRIRYARRRNAASARRLPSTRRRCTEGR